MKFSRTAAIALRHFYREGSPPGSAPFAGGNRRRCSGVSLQKYLNAVSSAGFDFVPSCLMPLCGISSRLMQGLPWRSSDVWSRNFESVCDATRDFSTSGLVIASVRTSSSDSSLCSCWRALSSVCRFLGYGVMVFPFLLILFYSGWRLALWAALVCDLDRPQNGLCVALGMDVCRCFYPVSASRYGCNARPPVPSVLRFEVYAPSFPATAPPRDVTIGVGLSICT
jgi:hypothetical protein